MRALLILASGCAVTPEWTCEPVRPEHATTGFRAYYDCVEATIPCGDAGYALGYGGAYAERFVTGTRPQLSPQGKAWLDAVLVCLQEALDARIGPYATCEDIWTAGFDTHPACYVDNGFCELPLDDVLKVGATLRAEDLSLPEQQAQVEAVAASCAERR